MLKRKQAGDRKRSIHRRTGGPGICGIQTQGGGICGRQTDRGAVRVPYTDGPGALACVAFRYRGWHLWHADRPGALACVAFSHRGWYLRTVKGVFALVQQQGHTSPGLVPNGAFILAWILQ